MSAVTSHYSRQYECLLPNAKCELTHIIKMLHHGILSRRLSVGYCPVGYQWDIVQEVISGILSRRLSVGYCLGGLGPLDFYLFGQVVRTIVT